MADFFENEAELSDVADSSDEEAGSSKVKAKKKSQQVISDDEDEEEEDDEEKLREEMKDLINDEEEEIEDDDDEGDAKRKLESEDEDDQLEDDDYALLEENLGIKVKRQQKRKRIRVLSDEEDSDKDEGKGEEDREAIANELFLENDEEELPDVAPKRHDLDLDIEASEEESDVDDFIVDESGQPLNKKAKKKKHIIHSDSALQEAQDIFGVDFDFEEFDKYGEGDDEFDEDEYLDDAELDAGEQPRTKKSSKRSTKKSIYEMYEPSDLERYQLTEADNDIRNTDTPERFQLRSIPVTSAKEEELAEEAIWIYTQAFIAPTVSRQNVDHGEGPDSQFRGRKAPSTVTKIKKALAFMRNQQFEVPFIAFYRKEDVEPELTINDLWKVWAWDEKWSQLKTRKGNLTRLFEKMQNYQYEQNSDPEKMLESAVRPLTEEDVERVRAIQTLEELRDMYSHFVLYYGTELPAMQHAEKIKLLAAETGEDNLDKLAASVDMLKQPTRKTGYAICVDAKLGDIADKFGLTAEQFGENLRDNYTRHDVDQCPLPPHELAEDYVCPQFASLADVMKGARYMVAMQLAHDPQVRRCARETFVERAKVIVVPTKRGIKEIDENHPCYALKYLKNRPVNDFYDDQYMRLMIAEADDLLKVTISIDGEDMRTTNYFDDIKQLYHRDEFSDLVQQWNNERSQALERALTIILYPQFGKEVSSKLHIESQQSVIRACCLKLHNYVKVAPYQADQEDVDEDDFDAGVRVLGMSYSTNRDNPAFGVIIDGAGEVTDHIRLVNLMNRRNAWRLVDREEKEKDLERLKDFIYRKKPHVIGVISESRDASMVLEDMKGCVSELVQERQMNPIGVELVSSELAHVYANTATAQRDFREFPEVLRQAISVARRLQDPLVEFTQLCNVDEDISCLNYHTLQEHLNKEELMAALSLEFVNRVNEVGVDINAALSQIHTAPLVQFVCGLGPRKASNLIKILKQSNGRLENRAQLVTTCNLGPKVFLNCAGFIKIDTTSLVDSTENYVEVLDGSRVHPETYEWARKMAVDALEYDDTAEDANPAGALEEILESPERLKDLDLEAFAEELERQGYGNKHITLYDIRAELNHRYKDLRTPYRSPSLDEVFHMLTKETPETLYIGRMVLSQVIGIAHKQPQGEEMDRAQPARSRESGLWQCPFCKKDDLPEISDVWGHFDSGTCPGRAVGVKTRMDNGIAGFIPMRMLSDRPVVDPEERVKVRMTVHGRIAKIDVERFRVELTTRSSDLIDAEGQWKPQRDPFYDFEREDQDNEKISNEKKQKARQTYIKRVIAHPSFRNIGYKECEKLLITMDSGDVVIRPSSKGADHLTITWKIADGVSQHIDVREEGKENAFSLGRSLWIQEEEFEDLDEIIARHIQPMAAFVRDIVTFRVFRSGDKDTIDKSLVDEKKKTPSRIPYYLGMNKECPPGKFTLSYLPRSKPRHEFVTVTPDGLQFRQQMFHSLNSLMRWFKDHYREPIPGTPAMSHRTPGMGRTPAIPTPGIPSTPALRGATPNMQVNPYKPMGTPQAMGVPGSFQGAYSGGYGYNAMNPGLTPSFRPHNAQFTTPAQPIVTPSYQPTPRWPGATPRTPAPPRTPASWTPSQQPQQQPQQPQQQPPSQQQRRNNTATDWAKAAANWAKNTNKKSARRRGDTTPAGDSTPLCDET